MVYGGGGLGVEVEEGLLGFVVGFGCDDVVVWEIYCDGFMVKI